MLDIKNYIILHQHSLILQISRFLEKIIEKVSSDKENCNNTHNLEQRSLQEKLNDSNIQLKAIMSRWNNREGRPQDLDRIQKL